MVEKAKAGHPKRLAYKTVLSLFPQEWDELKMEAQTRGITGAELIAAVLSKYVASSRRVYEPDDGDADPRDA